MAEDGSPLTTGLHRPSQQEAKRRKVRKGTHSCWECKRRKMRCLFDSGSSPICSPCRRRGSECISQEYVEDVVRSGKADKPQHTGNSISSSPDIENVTENGTRTRLGLLTPSTTDPGSSHYLNYYQFCPVSLPRHGYLFIS